MEFGLRPPAAGFRRILAFALLPPAISAAPVLANDSQVVDPQTPAPTPRDDPERYFDGGVVPVDFATYEREEVERREWLASPVAVQEREASLVAYADLSADESEALLRSVFHEQLAALNGDPARFLSNAKLTQPIGATAGAVEDAGEQMLLDGSVPLRAREDDGGLAKVDLTLESTGQGFETDNGLVDVVLPAAAGDAVEIGPQGFAVRQGGARDASARRFGDKNLFYPEVLPDTDLMIAATSGGIETFNLLRSRQSPEALRFEIELPAGATLRADRFRGAEVVRNGEVLNRISPPVAVDAQGTPVPVELQTEQSTVLLHVAHREKDLAYPLLVDPIFEEWAAAWHSWYEGKNLHVLNNGAWVYSRNNGTIYGNICCWNGVHAGLMASTTANAFYNPHQYGQWSYSTQNANTVITAAWINRFWRYDESCVSAQPHDYAGMLWVPGEIWNPVHMNAAKNWGEFWSEGNGHAFILGIGSGGPGVWIACGRHIYAGGVSLRLDDANVPSWNGSPSIADTWTDTQPVPVNVSGTDIGLGMKRFSVHTTKANGEKDVIIGDLSHPCTGLYGARCPASWTSQILNYAPGALPNGINPLVAFGHDPTGKWSQGHPVFVKVDHANPVVSVASASAKPLQQSLSFKVTAEDGNSSAFATAQSGMKSLEFYVDNVLAGRFPEKNPPDPCVNMQQGMNLGSCKFANVGIELAGALVGAHELKVVGRDSLNHPTTKTINLQIPEDEAAPEISVDGSLKDAEGAWLTTQEAVVNISGTDTDSGAVEAALYIDDELAAPVEAEECFGGGCSIAGTFDVDLAPYGHGQHQIKAVVRDARGNAASAEWEVGFDWQAPESVDVEVTPNVDEEWVPDLGEVDVTVVAGDSGVGVRRVAMRSNVLEAAEKLSGEEVLYPMGIECTGQIQSPCQQAVEVTHTFAVPDLVDGVVDLEFKVSDGGGRASTVVRELKVDTEAPSLSATGPLFEAPPEAVVGSEQPIEVTVSDSASGIDRLELYVDEELAETQTLSEIELEGGEQSCGAEGCQLDYDYVPSMEAEVESGTHEVELRAIDKVGQTDSVDHIVTFDNRLPSVALSGPLVDAAGGPLEIEEASLTISAHDGEGLAVTGVSSIEVAVDGMQIPSEDNCSEGNCPHPATAEALYVKSEWSEGPHQVEVIVTDGAGNTARKTVRVDAAVQAVAPSCPQVEPEVLSTSAVVSAAEAEEAAEEVLPETIAETEMSDSGAVPDEDDTAEFFDPSVEQSEGGSINEQGLDVVGTPAGGGAEDQPGAAFTVGQALCAAPLQTTTAETGPRIVNGDSILYANSAPATDSLIRPSVYGTTIVEYRRDATAPSEFSWAVSLQPGEELVELENGSVAVVNDLDLDLDEVEVPEQTSEATDIGDVDAQLESYATAMAEAHNEVDGWVTAVISAPTVIVNGQPEAGLLRVTGGETITAELPPGTVAAAEALIIEANAAADPVAMCAKTMADNTGFYFEACYDSAEEQELEPPVPGPDENINTMVFPSAPDVESKYLELESGGEASASVSFGDLVQCFRHFTVCPKFKDDATRAAAAEYGLFNVPSDNSKANAFRHAYWVALMTGRPGISDSLAWDFARNHEKGQLSSSSRKQQWSGRMDMSNNFVGFLYSHYRTQSNGTEIATCNGIMAKVGGSHHIGWNINPWAWTKKHLWEAKKMIFRRKYVAKVRVRLVHQNCERAINEGWGHVDIGY